MGLEKCRNDPWDNIDREQPRGVSPGTFLYCDLPEALVGTLKPILYPSGKNTKTNLLKDDQADHDDAHL